MLKQHNTTNGGSSMQVGGNLTQNRQTTFFSGNSISIVFIGIVILGGAWTALNLKLVSGNTGIILQWKTEKHQVN
jgi:hypothetical protein